MLALLAFTEQLGRYLLGIIQNGCSDRHMENADNKSNITPAVEIDSLPAEESYKICLQLFSVVNPVRVSTLLDESRVAMVLRKDFLFDAQMFQMLPRQPDFLPRQPDRINGERVYLLSLPKWRYKGLGIYLYFSQRQAYPPEFVDLSSDSSDVLICALEGVTPVAPQGEKIEPEG